MVFAILLVSITAALIGTLSYARARQALEAEARARLTLLARDVAEHLHRDFEDRVADITNWSRLEVMRALLYDDVDKELAEFVRQILQGRQTYLAIVCLGVDDRPVAGAGEVHTVIRPGAPDRMRIAIVAPDRGSGQHLLQFETPVFNPQRPGTRIGTLVVVLDPSRMITTIEGSVEEARGEVSLSLRSRTGEILFETGGSPVGGPGSPAAPDGSSVLKGVASVGRLSMADAPDLDVTVAQSRTITLAAVTALRATLFRVGALVLAIGSALGALVAWRISRPIRRLTGTVRQITERGNLETQIELPQASGEIGVLAAAFRTMMESLAAAQAEALAQSRLAFLGEIAANIAHEVRTPLSVLKTSAQLLARGELPLAEQRDLAATVAVEVDRLNGVVTGLVDLVRARPVHHRLESIADIVGRAVTFFSPVAAKSGVRIAQTLDDGRLPVYCSADQLHQVFLNLIQNAMQAMGGSGILTVTCREEGRWVAVEIADTGPGFTADTLARAFSPFYTTKVDGTGLGLAISKRIVEEHGGTIAAENGPRGGACLRVRLPIRTENA